MNDLISRQAASGSAAVEFNEQQARNFADMLHNITQIGGDTE